MWRVLWILTSVILSVTLGLGVAGYAHKNLGAGHPVALLLLGIVVVGLYSLIMFVCRPEMSYNIAHLMFASILITGGHCVEAKAMLRKMSGPLKRDPDVMRLMSDLESCSPAIETSAARIREWLPSLRAEDRRRTRYLWITLAAAVAALILLASVGAYGK